MARLRARTTSSSCCFVLGTCPRSVKAVVLVRHQLLSWIKPEGSRTSSFPFAHVLENILLRTEVPAVDAQLRIANGLNIVYHAVGAGGDQ